MIRPILLDTCAALWLGQAGLERAAREAFEEAASAGAGIYVSPITAWEIGMLVARGRLSLTLEPSAWFEALIATGVEPAELSPDILVQASFLPGGLRGDPADRIIASTARSKGYRVMTRDRRLRDYAAAGHMEAIAC